MLVTGCHSRLTRMFFGWCYMTYDSATPNLESNPNNFEPAQLKPHEFDENINPVLPDAEVNTVLHFISNPTFDDGSHFISSLANSETSVSNDEEKLEAQSIVVETSIPTYLSTPVAEYKVDSLLDDREVRMTNDVNSDVVYNTQVPVGPDQQQLDTPSRNTKIVEANNLPSETSVENSPEVFEQKQLPPPGSNEVLQASSSEEKSELPVEDTVKEEGIIANLTDEDITSLDSLPEPVPSRNIQVQFKTEAERLVIILPKESQISINEYSWSEIWQQLKQRLNGGDRLRVANTNVHLVAGDRLLDGRQLQELGESLKEVELQLKSVATSRRQTAIAAVTAGYSVEQLQLQPKISLSEDKNAVTPSAEPLYMEMTIRSGIEIRHPGTVIILGDVNPGGIVVASGDILVWGRLRGVAHAGVSGNSECLIMALQMEPTQLRIADAVARAPEKAPTQFYPEVAYVTSGVIHIAKAADFSRLSKINQQSLKIEE
ncbi:septum formation inhibitor [Calothrix sp. NIES-4071]|nr:septum formation inhibitor [Calothrix sp. NIES-4071]BAZ59271.1 septum formation inhibitor [Calothrix sp. NIES-4105]